MAESRIGPYAVRPLLLWIEEGLRGQEEFRGHPGYNQEYLSVCLTVADILRDASERILRFEVEDAEKGLQTPDFVE